MELPKLDAASLRSEYQRRYGKPAPKRGSILLLRHAIANRLHQLLLARLRAKLQQVLNAGDAIVSILVADSSQAELVCEWAGRVYTVTLVEDGVLFKGRHFRSLSAVAHAITGEKLSGPDLFGTKAARRNEAGKA
jgi:hypothetical protein